MVLVKSYRRRRVEPDIKSPPVVIVQMPPPEPPSKKPTLKERVKKGLAVPKRKRRVRPRTDYDDIGEGADDVARMMEQAGKK